MLALLLFAAVLGNIEGTDFVYYYPNSTSNEGNDGTVFVRTWSGLTGQADPIAWGPPQITSFNIPSGSQYPKSSFHLKQDVYYVVLDGKGTINNVNSGTEFNMGDLAWVMSGYEVGPFVNTGTGNFTVYAIGAQWAPQYKSVDLADNPTMTSPTQGVNYCNFQVSRDCSFSGEHSGDYIIFEAGGKGPCISGSGRPGKSCLQSHYHPRGALYVGLTGNMFYGQDYDGIDAWISHGDVRWVRPGVFYGPEYTNDGCSVLAIHPSHGGAGLTVDDTNPWISFDEPPAGPFVVQYPLTVSKVWNEEDSHKKLVL